MLIRCVVYKDGRKLADIDASEIHQYVDQPECFVWVALYEPDGAALEQMQHEFKLHPLAIEDARHGHQRPKFEEYGESLFVVLHTIEPDAEGLRVGEVDIFVGPNYILSVRTHSERGFQDVRARSEAEPRLLKHGSGYMRCSTPSSIAIFQCSMRLSASWKRSRSASSRTPRRARISKRCMR